MPRAEVFPDIRRKTFVDLKRLREESSIEEDIYTLEKNIFYLKKIYMFTVLGEL